MISCPRCSGRMVANGKYWVKTYQVHCRRFLCTCCGKSRRAYSEDGEVWRWDYTRAEKGALPAHRPAKDWVVL